MKSPQKAAAITRDPIILTPTAPDGPIPLDDPIIQTVNTMWDQRNFSTPRTPIVIGQVQDREGFSKIGPGVKGTSYMPIKMPGTDYRLPPELVQFQDTLETMIGYEHAINPEVDDTYAYLTIDFAEVKASKQHRKGGSHSDGFQGARVQPRHKTSRLYAVSNAVPTMYHPQSFDTTGLDPAVDNYFLKFDTQVDDSKTKQLVAYDIALMDAYTVHEVAFAEEDTFRIFMRVSYEYREFDRLGCTHNPYFDYDWEMVPRDIPEGLK